MADSRKTDSRKTKAQLIAELEAANARVNALEQEADSEQRLFGVLGIAGDAIISVDEEQRIVLFNRGAEAIFGYKTGEVIGKRLDMLIPEEWRKAHRKHITAFAAAAETTRMMGQRTGLFGLRKNGRRFPAEASISKAPLQDGTVFTVILRDVSSRRSAEEELRENRRLLQTIFDTIPHWLMVKDKERRFIMINDALAQSMGLNAEEVRGKRIEEISTSTEEEQQVFKDTDRRVLENRERLEIPEYGVTNASGEEQVRRAVKLPLLNDDDEVVGLVAISEDITGYKRAEAELRRSEQRFRDIAEISSDWFWEMDSELRFTWISNRAEEVTGVPVDFRIGKTRQELAVGNDDPEKWVRHQQDLEARKPFRDFRYWRGTPDGRKQYLSISGTPILGEHGEFLGYHGTGTDITERERAQEEIRAGQRLLQTIFDTIPHWVMVKDTESRFIMVNKAFADDHGSEPGRYVGKLTDEAGQGTAEEMDIYLSTDRRVLETGERVETPQYTVTFDSGATSVRHSIKLPLRDDQGKIIGLVGVSEDVTERKLLEERLRQAQKLEAVGQLAGGVAHEFNNLLQIISGTTELALADAQEGDSRREPFNTIRRAAERGANLVRQLLGFSRRQQLQPTMVDVNSLVTGLANLVITTIGEQIQLQFKPGADLRTIQADPGAVEQVLLNLCINARDAMPGGGRLTLSTADVSLDEAFCGNHPWARAGEYVRITIADSGEGMGQDVLEHIFEPFFTTKGPQEGSGLGLALVYGLIEQQGGLIDVESEPGRGTEFQIYLPAAQGKAPSPKAEIVHPQEAGGGTILVAEDERQVQQLTAQMLENKGYKVFSAFDGEQAVKLFESHARTIDFVLLDLVMPKIGGREVFQRIRTIQPDVPVLFQTGYGLRSADADFMTAQGLRVLRKPYTESELLRALHDLR